MGTASGHEAPDASGLRIELLCKRFGDFVAVANVDLHVRGVILLPLVILPIIPAMAFYRMWVDLGLLDSYAGMIAAHAILASPIVPITVSASLANFDLRLERASNSTPGGYGWTSS